MAQVIGFTPEDWPHARDAINAVRRGGLEHPFYRRMPPIGVSDEVRRFKSAETTTILGPEAYDIGGGSGSVNGFSSTGVAYLVQPDGTYDDTTTYDVDTSELCAFVYPDVFTLNDLDPHTTFRAVNESGTWKAISGGSAMWKGEVSGVVVAGSAYSITLYILATSSPTSETATPGDIIAFSPFGVEMVVGQEVFGGLIGSIPVIMGAGCVPDE